MARNSRRATKKKAIPNMELQLEAKAQEASQALTKKQFKNMAEAARSYGIPYHKFRRRHRGLTKPRSIAQVNQRLLTVTEEETVCTWIKYMGMTGHPISIEGLRIKVAEISTVLQEQSRTTGERELPGRGWVYAFAARHPEIDLKRPTGLDPKRAQCFNRTVVARHFRLLGDFLNLHDIPWDNVYNMDEKGIQLGGGRKFDNTKYLYSRLQRNRVKLQSPDLELVTTIECVSADGFALKPGFVFCGKHVLHDEYFEEDGIL